LTWPHLWLRLAKLPERFQRDKEDLLQDIILVVILTCEELIEYLENNVPWSAEVALGKEQHPVVLNAATGADFQLPIRAIPLTKLIDDVAEQIDLQMRLEKFPSIGIPEFTSGASKSFDPQYGELPKLVADSLRKSLGQKARKNRSGYEILSENALREELQSKELTPNDLGTDKTKDIKIVGVQIPILVDGHLSLFGNGGLLMRCPNEVLSLKWTDIDWERGEITVTDNKLGHHPGKETRLCPLFPELKPYLDESFQLAKDGDVYVVDEAMRKSALTKNGWKNCNLRTEMNRIIRKAGLVPWKKPFNNLRSTRETELNEVFPAHVVASWIGHSVKIAKDHYLQVTKEHHQRALEYRAKTDDSPTHDVTYCGTKPKHQERVAQKAAQSASVRGGNRVQIEVIDFWKEKLKQAVTTINYKVLQPVSMSCRIDGVFSKNGVADGEGFEPTDESPRRRFSRPVP